MTATMTSQPAMEPSRNGNDSQLVEGEGQPVVAAVVANDSQVEGRWLPGNENDSHLGAIGDPVDHEGYIAISDTIDLAISLIDTDDDDAITQVYDTALPRGRFACADLPVSWFYPDAEDDSDNHGAAAKATCATCPVREACLMGAVARGEEFGIWGGAGEPRRRVIRRAMRQGPDVVTATVAAHWAQLDGDTLDADQRRLLVAFGEGATHGRRVTQAKGCRCGACRMAPSWESKSAFTFRRPTRKTTKRNKP